MICDDNDDGGKSDDDVDHMMLSRCSDMNGKMKRKVMSPRHPMKLRLLIYFPFLLPLQNLQILLDQRQERNLNQRELTFQK